ncbi:PA2485 family small membrane protein [Pseudomonas chaetocerotis]|nr:PA2485 family small membrane protein [Pseudomonas chaetocerotis]
MSIYAALASFAAASAFQATAPARPEHAATAARDVRPS